MLAFCSTIFHPYSIFQIPFKHNLLLSLKSKCTLSTCMDQPWPGLSDSPSPVWRNLWKAEKTVPAPRACSTGILHQHALAALHLPLWFWCMLGVVVWPPRDVEVLTLVPVNVTYLGRVFWDDQTKMRSPGRSLIHKAALLEGEEGYVEASTQRRLELWSLRQQPAGEKPGQTLSDTWEGLAWPAHGLSLHPWPRAQELMPEGALGHSYNATNEHRPEGALPNYFLFIIKLSSIVQNCPTYKY